MPAFAGNLLKGFAQILLVIRSMGVMTEASGVTILVASRRPSGFPQNGNTSSPMLERHDRDHLKECRQAVGRKFFKSACRHSVSRTFPPRTLAGDSPNAFRLSKCGEVYSPVFSLASSDALQHGAHRPLAVGASHVNETQAFVRIAGVCGELARIVEASLEPSKRSNQSMASEYVTVFKCCRRGAGGVRVGVFVGGLDEAGKGVGLDGFALNSGCAWVAM